MTDWFNYFTESDFETETKKNLFNKIKDLSNGDGEFIIGIMNYFYDKSKDNEKQAKDLLDWLNETGEKNRGNILLKKCDIIGDPIFCND